MGMICAASFFLPTTKARARLRSWPIGSWSVLGWAKKISAQRNRTGQAERVPHRAGRKPHAGAEAQQQVLAWIEAKPDLTLAEIQDKLRSQAAVRLSIPQIWHLLRKMGLRLKKSRSTPASATAKPTASGARNSRRG